jgi:hypothetical protein
MRARPTWHSAGSLRPRRWHGRRLRMGFASVPRAACDSRRRSSARTIRWPGSLSTAGRRATASGASSFTVSGGRANPRRRLGKIRAQETANSEVSDGPEHDPAYPPYERVLRQERGPCRSAGTSLRTARDN